MQGFFRYSLAHLVVLGHLWGQLWEHKIAHPGVYAVFSFYLLSGYLMALTLTRTYAFDLRGTARFFGNRALRIYPPYLALVACTSLVLIYAPPNVRVVNPFLRLPDSGLGWLYNVLLVAQVLQRFRDLAHEVVRYARILLPDGERRDQVLDPGPSLVAVPAGAAGSIPRH